MTPKEKAKQLFERYLFVEIANYTSKFEIKQCALIAVDEIINYHPSYPMPLHLGIKINGLVDNLTFPFKYWEEVKKEIEKL